MLTLFCLGEFMDAFIASCLFPAINALREHLHLKPTEVTWAFGAYTATFAAFLLISGRVSDVYSPRTLYLFFFLRTVAESFLIFFLLSCRPFAGFCFNGGAFLIGAFSLGSGFAQGKVSFFILRAFAGMYPVSLPLPPNLFEAGFVTLIYSLLNSTHS
jgi:MFS family permease